MSSAMKASIDAILNKVVSSDPRVPGVVAMVTDRNANSYEGAASKHVLGKDADMTSDSVFAIFSTTKAITGTTIMQCVEEASSILTLRPRLTLPTSAAGARRLR